MYKVAYYITVLIITRNFIRVIDRRDVWGYNCHTDR